MLQAGMRHLALALVLLASCKSKTEAPKASPAPPAAPADAAVKDDLARALTAIKDKLGLPAVTAAAWRDGTLIEEAAIGLRRADDVASAVGPNDLWHLGSNTKAMTAALIAIYVDRGTLRWTDTIAQLAPKSIKVDPGFKDVTLDMLIRHEGGVSVDPPAVVWKQLWTDGSKPEARTNFVRSILGAAPAHKPGTFEYSNTNYIIAGALLEAKTGKRWAELIKSELWDKLDMKSCGFGAPGVKGVNDQPRGHDAGGSPIEPGEAGDNPPGLGPAGTAHCSIADYGKFLNMFATGKPALITPATQQQLLAAHSTDRMNYAGGWMVVATPKSSMLVHSGSNTMWYVTAVVVPDKHVAFVIATNKGEGKIEESLESLLKRYLAP